ncbi:MAG TPA: NAD(P)H-hydrate dehydratase [Steroidobacteraceae bacterium]|nr:NAD(P)H-hydrate dehydratase [Steroidobacteraceae bacterium]
MEPLPVEVYSAAQVRAMDRHAIGTAGIPGYTLMQRAGAAALDCLRRSWPQARRIAIACGAGNNAGDGYVLARLARAAGLETAVAALVDPARLTGDAAMAFADFSAAGGRCEPFSRRLFGRAAVIVDALLGTGLDRPVAGSMRACIEALNASGLPLLALDIPSGLDADTGRVRGMAIAAARTITFVGLKSGLYLGAAREHVGALEFAGLGVPASARAGATPVLRRMDTTLLAAALPKRGRLAHKGAHGRVLVVGGHAMAGAARLAGEAALRSGAGLVAIATTASAAGAIVGRRPELICHAATSAVKLRPLLKAADAVAIGPGLGLDRRAKLLLEATLAAGRPCVVDADALTLAARRPRRRDHWILTPHPGEAARLLGTGTAAVQRDRLAALRAIATKYGGTCVLKGAGTLVSSQSGPPWVCDRGNPGMATAGAGDVLTGIIVALIAGGAGPELAAPAGVLLHAIAGDRAAAGGERGVIAGDLIAELRRAAQPPWS